MKILIVKTSSLGDIIHCFPVLDYLRRKFPGATIDWVVEYPYTELVRSNPQSDSVLAIHSKQWRKSIWCSRKEAIQFIRHLREKKYDILFDLQGNLKSSGVTYFARATQKVGFGFKSVREWPNIFFTSKRINPPKGQNIREDYLSVVKSFFEDDSDNIFNPIPLKLDALQQQKLIAIVSQIKKIPTLVCPSSTWRNKCLSEESLVQFLKKLDRSPYWFIWGNSTERECVLKMSAHFQESIVLERVDLPVLQHIMTYCQLVVAMDSLPLHLCGTTQTPSLSFFGPSSAHKFAPLGTHHASIQGKCPYKMQFEKTCPKLRNCSTGACLK